MDRRPLALAALLATGCAGHSPAPASTTGPRAVAPASAPAAAEPSGLRYATDSSRFRVEGESHVVQEVMGQEMAVDVTSRQLLSVVAAVSGENLSVALTIDSIDVQGPPGTDLSAGNVVIGHTFRMVVSRLGTMLSVSASDSTDPALAQFAAGQGDFLPQLPAAPVSIGQTWTDTLSRSQQGPVAVAVCSVRQHQVVGWEDRGGVRSLHLTTTASYSLSGSGDAQGQTVEVSGTGRSIRHAYVSSAGVFLGSTEADSAQITATLTAMGIAVPIRQARTTTVSRVP